MKNPAFFSLFLFLFSVSIFSCGDDDNTTPEPNPNPVTSEEELTDALQKAIDDSEMPGMTVAVVKNNEITFQKSFGYADVTAQKVYTNQTTQPIGSVSKTFIGAAIVKAIEEGYFTLETNVNDILPVELINPKNPDAIIRVKDLVTHTSSLLDNVEAYNLAYHILPGENMSSEGAQLMVDFMGVQQRETYPLYEFLAEYYLEDGDIYSEYNFSESEPGTEWNYSNLASSLAAVLIESATGKSYDDYVAEKIFQPLGMSNTAFFSEELSEENMATLYFGEIPLPLYANDSYPDGSVNTSNEDLTKYMLDMMKGAAGNSETLFSKAGYEMLFEPLLSEGVMHPALGENQGVFWVLDSGDIKHDGGDPGLAAFMQFSKTGEAGFLLMTNMDASTEESEEDFAEVIFPIFSAIGEYLSAN